MLTIFNSLIPFKGYKAINLFGILFIRSDATPMLTHNFIHEEIHTQQMKYMLFIPFYVWYFFEWVIRWISCGFNQKEAYMNISFEREAYDNEYNHSYIKERHPYGWFKYLKEA